MTVRARHARARCVTAVPDAGPVPALSYPSLRHRYRASMTSLYRAVLSPCIGVCTVADDGLCDGCHRTTGEIARWIQMSDDERLRLMEDVLPERERRRA